jgi:hypothetical protein
MTPDEYLSAASDTFREKRKQYGNNYRVLGKVMSAMFPDGLTIKTETDWNRIHLFLLSMVKKTRYANNYEKGGHEDSVIDDIVYLAMLHEIDDEATCKKFLSEEKRDAKA